MKFIIPNNIKRTIETLVKENDNEFTLFGKTRIDGEQVIVTDIRIPDQRSGKAATEVSSEELMTFMDSLLKDKENPADWNLWIHSHNTMGAFWSGTDTAQMDAFRTAQTPYFFYIVTSTKGWRGAAHVYKPFAVYIDEIAIEFAPDSSNPKIAAIENKITALYEQLALLQATNPMADKLRAELTEKNKILAYNYNSFYGNGNDKPLSKKALKKLTREHIDDCVCSYCNELWYRQTGGKYDAERDSYTPASYREKHGIIQPFNMPYE